MHLIKKMNHATRLVGLSAMAIAAVAAIGGGLLVANPPEPAQAQAPAADSALTMTYLLLNSNSGPKKYDFDFMVREAPVTGADCLGWEYNEDLKSKWSLNYYDSTAGVHRKSTVYQSQRSLNDGDTARLRFSPFRAGVTGLATTGTLTYYCEQADGTVTASERDVVSSLDQTVRDAYNEWENARHNDDGSYAHEMQRDSSHYAHPEEDTYHVRGQVRKGEFGLSWNANPDVCVAGYRMLVREKGAGGLDDDGKEDWSVHYTSDPNAGVMNVQQRLANNTHIVRGRCVTQVVERNDGKVIYRGDDMERTTFN